MTSINTNIGSMIAQKNMLDNTKDLDQAMARISSGLRINSAADDAAGSAIASKMEAQVKSLGVAIRNSNDAISMTQTAEGALNEMESILQRVRELAVQAGNSTLSSSDRSMIQSEVNALTAEINSIAAKTNFNGVKLLDGSAPSLIKSGVSKSGSPAAKPIISIPCDFNKEAFAVTARVGDSLMRWTAEDRVIFSDKVSN